MMQDKKNQKNPACIELFHQKNELFSKTVKTNDFPVSV